MSSTPSSAPARPAGVRAHNLALVMGEVADGGPVSRARLATRTGLTKSTVSSLVDTLVSAGLLVELGPQSGAGVGRPASGLALGLGPAGIGVEVNVDYVSACVVQLDGRVRHRELVADDFRETSPEVVLDRAGSLLARALRAAGDAGIPVAGVAVAVPGLVEADRGLLRFAPNLGWRDVWVPQELRKRAGVPAQLPVRLDNEANLAALAELWCGAHRDAAGRPLRDFLHVSGEIGVGSAVVLSGALFRGARGFGGEIGHLPLAAEGSPCRCGGRGCLEQSAGQEALLRAAGLSAPARTAVARPQGSVGDLLSAAQDADPRALAAIAAAGHSLGQGLAAALNLLDLPAVVLGGLYAGLAPWIGSAVQQELELRVPSSRWAPVQVLVAALGGEGAVRGAALSVVRGVIADPAGHLAG